MKFLKKFLLITMLIGSATNAQINENVKRIVSKYPSSIANSKQISSRINKDFDNDYDKLGAIYFWIASNIAYDVKAAFSKNKKESYTYWYRTEAEKTSIEKNINDEVIGKTLRNQKATCEGYTRVFRQLCDLTGLECVVIAGLAKTQKNEIGTWPKKNRHAWNAAKINGKWELIDVTWGAGYVKSKKFIKNYKEYFFCSDPEIFFHKHYPTNKQWLFTQKTKQDFINLPLYHSNYQMSSIRLMNPINGVIDLKNNDLIYFKARLNTKFPSLTYAFDNDMYSKKIDINYQNDEIYFFIPLENKKKRYLTLYDNNKAIATYKLLHK